MLRQELQQRDEILHQQLNMSKRIEKKAHLESELSGMIPSSEPPTEVHMTCFTMPHEYE